MAKLRSAIQALDEASCQLYVTQGVGDATHFVERWTEEHPGEEVRFVRILTPYTNGQHLDNEKLKDIVVYRQARKVEVEAPEGFAYSLDGEIIYESHFTVEVAEKALDFAVPDC